MKSKYILYSAIFSIIFLVTQHRLYAQKTIPTDLKDWVTKKVEQNKMSGAVIAVANKKGTIYEEAFGRRNDKQDMQIHDLFSIASMSKVITTIAALQLIEKNKLTLEDPISKYIPRFKETKILNSFSEIDGSYTTQPLERPITIHHLLNHTSGIVYEDEHISKIMTSTGFDTLNYYNTTLEEFVDRLSLIPIKHNPGDAWTYGHSTDVLGYIIEVVSGLTLDTYFRQYIFEPLGMNSSGFSIPKNDYSKYASLYRSKNNNLIELTRPDLHLPADKTVKLFYGGSGIISTAHDFLQIAMMLLNDGKLNGQRIISKKSLELMISPHIGNLRYPDMFYWLLGDGNTFGYGVNIVTENGSKNVSYSEGSYFWEGRFGTSFIIDPTSEIAAVFMTQTITEEPIRQEFRDQVVKQFANNKAK